MLDALGYPNLQLTDQLLGVILYILQHLLDRLTIENLVDVIVPVLHGDMDSRRVAKEVMHIAQNLLVGSHKEHAEIIVLILLQ